MIETFQYKNDTYKIIESINLNGISFALGKNKNNYFTYMKITQLTNKTVFTPLKSLIKVLSDYNNQQIYNIQNSLDYFISRMNKLIKKGRIRYYNSSEMFIDLKRIIEHNKMYDGKQLTRKDLKKIDSIFDKYQSKPLLLKLCNIYGLLLLVSIVCIGYFSNNLLNWYNDGKNAKKISTTIAMDTNSEETDGFTKEEVENILENEQDDVEKYNYDYWVYSNVTMLSVDFNDLLNQNPDTVAWLYINNTTVDYPIVQSGDNSFYLDHSFDQSYNPVGWLFADFRSNFKDLEKNTVIYGHGRLDNVMFGSLHKVLDYDWYSNPENQIIKMSTPDKNMMWQIVSIYTIPSESYYLTHTFENDESYRRFLDTILSRSIADFNVTLNTDDHILTLSTCLDNNGNRIVVHAKLVKVENR